MFSFAFSRPGSDLLSRVLRRSTIGAGAFHGRVRNGNGCSHPARTTRSAKGKCSCGTHEHSFLLALADLTCSLVARRGAKAAIRERMNMPCMMMRSWRGRASFFTRLEPLRMAPAAGRAEPPAVRRAVRSEAIEDRDSVRTKGLCSSSMSMNNENDQANRAISTGKLHALLRFHTRPINVVVFHGSQGNTRFQVGFPLRCLQRLSLPYIATLLCPWQDNRSTRDMSIPVLSY